MKASNDNPARTPNAVDVAESAEVQQEQNEADPFAPEGEDENLLTDAQTTGHDLSEADRLKATKAAIAQEISKEKPDKA